MASPQDSERTSVERFKPFVTDVVSTFKDDARVLWWEVYNEPKRSDKFSLALRAAAYAWAKAAKPSQPVAVPAVRAGHGDSGAAGSRFVQLFALVWPR